MKAGLFTIVLGNDDADRRKSRVRDLARSNMLPTIGNGEWFLTNRPMTTQQSAHL
jgi:hypothetical protein